MINDGTGINPSVRNQEARLLLPWLIDRTGATSIVDLGTGVGWLVKVAESAGIRCLGVEGNPDCAAKKVCASDLLVADVTQHVFTERFDLATSFECIEHMGISHQEPFFRGASTASDRLICSIHVGNGENDEHHLIRDAEWWLEWFEMRNIAATEIDDFPLDFNLSVCFDLDLSGMK